MATERPQMQAPIVMLTPEQHAAQTIARELQEMREQGIKLDEAKVPGGVFEDRPGAGTFHDAHGRPVTEDGELIVEGMVPRAGAAVGGPYNLGAAASGGPEVTDAMKAGADIEAGYRADMEAQRKASEEEGNPNLEADEAHESAPARKSSARRSASKK